MHKYTNTRQMRVYRRRRGATIIECAFTLPVMLYILFAMLDLGIATIRYNALAEASRRVAREVIRHGELASQTTDVWGPDPFAGTVADNSDEVISARNALPTMAPQDVGVSITWLDGSNLPRNRIRVELDYTHVPLLPAISLWGSLELRSVSTMHVVN